MIVRSLVLLACVAALVAGEAGPEVAPPTLAFSSGGPMHLSMTAGKPSEAIGGVRMRYEAVRLECDHLTYILSAYQSADKPVLATADLFGGPAGPPDGRVLFDSTASRLQQASFRGVMHPRTLAIRRLDADPQRPQVVRYNAKATELGDIVGMLMTPAGERQHVGWADSAVLDFEAPLAPGSAMGLGTPRLIVLHFYGRPAADGQPARPAIVLRLPKPVPAEQATVDGLLATKSYGMLASGMTMSLYFDEKGGLANYQSDTGVYEVLDGEDLVPRLNTLSRPKIGP